MHGVQAAVASEFLDSLNSERQLDLPVLAMLVLLGYENVALTHGPTEMGRDYIAQIGVPGSRTQWSLQAKKGNVGLEAWRREVKPQLEEALEVPFVHPCFDASLSKVVVLITSGELSSSVQPRFEGRAAEFRKRGAELQLWHRQRLIEKFAETQALANWRRWATIGHALQLMRTGRSGVEAIRSICRDWVSEGALERSRFWKSLMSLSLLAAFLGGAGLRYQSHRAMCGIVCLVVGAHGKGWLPIVDARNLLDGVGANLLESTLRPDDWQAVSRLRGGEVGMYAATVYPMGVWIQMLMEDLGLGLAIAACAKVDLGSTRRRLLTTVRQVARMGISAKPPGENYAVSVMLGVVGMWLLGLPVRDYLVRVGNWLFESYRKRIGLARVGAPPFEEVMYVGPWRLDHRAAVPHNASTIAPAILDMACVLGDQQTYEQCQRLFVSARDLTPHKLVPNGSPTECVGAGGFLVTACDYPPGWMPRDGWRVAESHARVTTRWFDEAGLGWVGMAMSSWFRDRWWLASFRMIVAEHNVAVPRVR